MTTKTLEQRRAANALRCVESFDGSENKILGGRYRTYTEALPAHILMGGLGQAFATELAAARLAEDGGNDGQDGDRAGRKAHAQLARDLQSWLSESTYRGLPPAKKTKSWWLLDAITTSDQQNYLHAQAEALAWLIWLKKFSQAMLPKVKEE